MNPHVRVLVSAVLASLALASARSVRADDTGSFVVRLGQDTVSVERYTRSASRVEVFQVGRAPRVLQRHFIYDYAKGALTHVSLVVTPPGSTTPTQTIDAKVDGDSLRSDTRAGEAPPQISSVGFPAGTQVLTTSSPWTGYETQVMRFVKAKKDSLAGTAYFLGGPGTNRLTVRRVNRDSVSVVTDRGDVFHMRVDKTGRIVGVLPIAGTGMYSVDRVAKLDESAYAAAFAAREQAGGGLGVLSPRDTVAIDAGGAALWFDYGRPAKRGRTIFGNVVPFGAVWRTGANAATQFKTDKPLDFGGVVVPPGFYTLWTIPSTDGWKLVVNSETGQWGTAHKAEKDLYTIDMKSGVLPELVERFTIHVDPTAQGGVINLDWDTTRASVEFTVKPVATGDAAPAGK